MNDPRDVRCVPAAFRGLRDSEGVLLIPAGPGEDFVVLGRPARWSDDPRWLIPSGPLDSSP